HRDVVFGACRGIAFAPHPQANARHTLAGGGSASMTSESTPKGLKDILAKIDCAKTEDIAQLQAEIFPDMVDLSEAEVDKVLQQLKVVTKIALSALRKDWTEYLSANGLSSKAGETSAA